MEENKMIIVKFKERSSVTLPTMFDNDDYIKEYPDLHYSDCKSDLMNNTHVLRGDFYGRKE